MEDQTLEMPSQLIRGRATKILVLNPNSSQSMTEGMTGALNSPDLGLPFSTEIHTYTAPVSSRAPASINDGDDIAASTAAVLADFSDADRAAFDGILVACFSVHPLVRELQAPESRAVTGIFEASVLTALSLLRPPPSSPEGSSKDGDLDKWGIVTTGKFWEDHLADGVRAFLGGHPGADSARFAGVESTGLNASDFHDGVPPEVVREKLVSATRRLLRGGRTTVVVMGCAGMAGLEEIIRSAAKEDFGEHFAYEVLHVVDGVRAGILQVETMIKHQRLRGRPRT